MLTLKFHAPFAVALLMLSGCSSTGVVQMGKDAYMISKKSAQVGFGPPIGIKGEAYQEATDHCAKSGKIVEATKYNETNSGFGRAAAVALEFKCV